MDRLLVIRLLRAGYTALEDKQHWRMRWETIDTLTRFGR